MAAALQMLGLWADVLQKLELWTFCNSVRSWVTRTRRKVYKCRNLDQEMA